MSGKGGVLGGNGREIMELCLFWGEEFWCDVKVLWGSIFGV